MRLEPSFSQHKLLKILHEHMARYHISLGNGLETSIGSGFFVKFDIVIEHAPIKIYGIITAQHVLDDDDPNQQALCKSIIVQKTSGRHLIILSKLIDNAVVASFSSFEFFYGIGLKKKVSSRDKYNPDLGFICLGYGDKLAKHKLLEKSQFYDLDKHQNDDLNSCQTAIVSGFYRGSHDKDADNLPLMGPYFGGGEKLTFNPITKVQYWKLPNPWKLIVCGASGAAFWRLHLNGNIPEISLGGVIVCLSNNHQRIHATSAQYLYESFLAELKKVCEIELTKRIKNLTVVDARIPL